MYICVSTTLGMVDVEVHGFTVIDPIMHCNLCDLVRVSWSHSYPKLWPLIGLYHRHGVRELAINNRPFGVCTKGLRKLLPDLLLCCFHAQTFVVSKPFCTILRAAATAHCI